jgi:hypothetical protein
MASFTAAPAAAAPAGAQAAFPMKWAQRADCVYLTITLADVTGEKIGLTEDTLTFSGKSGDGRQWAGEVALFLPVDPDASTWNVGPRSIAIKLTKKETSDEFWPRLLKVCEISVFSLYSQRIVSKSLHYPSVGKLTVLMSFSSRV